jgi:biopolymer transport protein ExbD
LERKREHDETGVNLGIIITPMLDMSFQILAFFIMTYHPSALEGHFDIKLLPPKLATKGAAMPSDTLPPANEDPELNDVLTVTVKTVGKGQQENALMDGDPSRILLTRPEDASNPVLIADSDTLGKKDPKGDNIGVEEGLKLLGAELKKFLDDPSHSKANIKIEPDPDLKHKYTMQVYDACKLAGFQNIQFIGPAIDTKK